MIDPRRVRAWEAFGQVMFDNGIVFSPGVLAACHAAFNAGFDAYDAAPALTEEEADTLRWALDHRLPTTPLYRRAQAIIARLTRGEGR